MDPGSKNVIRLAIAQTNNGIQFAPNNSFAKIEGSIRSYQSFSWLNEHPDYQTTVRVALRYLGNTEPSECALINLNIP